MNQDYAGLGHHSLLVSLLHFECFWQAKRSIEGLPLFVVLAKEDFASIWSEIRWILSSEMGLDLRKKHELATLVFSCCSHSIILLSGDQSHFGLSPPLLARKESLSKPPTENGWKRLLNRLFG